MQWRWTEEWSTKTSQEQSGSKLRPWPKSHCTMGHLRLIYVHVGFLLMYLISFYLRDSRSEHFPCSNLLLNSLTIAKIAQAKVSSPKFDLGLSHVWQRCKHLSYHWVPSWACIGRKLDRKWNSWNLKQELWCEMWEYHCIKCLLINLF